MPGFGGLICHTKHRVLVRIESNRPAMCCQIQIERLKVTECALRRHKPQLHQRTGRIVNEHKQGASRTAILKPMVIRSINLDQFAEAFPTQTRLMERAALFAGIAANCPEARLRLVGQHSDDPRAGEDRSTVRLRAVVLTSELVNAGFPSDQLILNAPSYANPIDGLSDSRVDFDVILEDL
jgi:hypothetical protein